MLTKVHYFASQIILHYPPFIIFFSMLLFLLAFVIIDIFYNRRLSPLITRALMLAIASLLIATLFKILHWRGADMLLLISMGGMALIYLIESISHPKIKPAEHIMNIFMVLLAIGLLFFLLHWKGALPLLVLAVIAMLIRIGLQWNERNNRDEK